MPYKATSFIKCYAFGRDPLTSSEKDTLDLCFKFFDEGITVKVIGGTTKKTILRAEDTGLRTVILGFARDNFHAWDYAISKARKEGIVLSDAGGNVVWNPESTCV
jgi:3-keto-L-gulonate-6-phosphate decarboxylase